MNLLTGEDFERLFTSFDHTAFRFETRDRYNVDAEQEHIRKFLAGEPDPERRWRPWHDTVRNATTAGKRFMRVRAVSVPLSDYARFGLVGAEYNNEAGEDIRYMERTRYRELGLPEHDVWLFDSQRLAFLHFDDDDRLVGAEITTDPDTVLRHCQWRDVAWHYAVTRDEFAAKHPV
jgi:hypothetical protein